MLVSAVTNKQSNISGKYFFSLESITDKGSLCEEILLLPYQEFIEKPSGEPLRKQEKYSLHNPDIFLAITTGSCYQISLARIFTNNMVNRFALNHSKKPDIVTCLHEAIMNAMLHGNLEMHGEFHTKSGFYSYHSEIEKRLSEKNKAHKYIYLGAWQYSDSVQISVSDDGEGFDIPDISRLADSEFPRGRGLMFIHSLADEVWLEKDKKTLSMRFYW